MNIAHDVEVERDDGRHHRDNGNGDNNDYGGNKNNYKYKNNITNVSIIKRYSCQNYMAIFNVLNSVEYSP